MVGSPKSKSPNAETDTAAPIIRMRLPLNDDHNVDASRRWCPFVAARIINDSIVRDEFRPAIP